MKVLCFVLLVVLSVLAEGCRDGETTSPPAPSLSFALNLTAGARFTYNTWTLDQSYSQLPAAKTTTSWTVLNTQQKYQGMNGVTLVADSSITGIDTLYLATAPNGDLYIYGFLAQLNRRRQGDDIPPRWDLVAAFSQGQNGSWTVGTADSLGQMVVYGSAVGASDYYSTSVDGVTEVFPTYRVDLTGETLYCSIWFSNSPDAIVRLLDEPDYPVTGQLQELAAVRGQH